VSEIGVQTLQGKYGTTPYHLVMLGLVRWSHAILGDICLTPACWYDVDVRGRHCRCRICGVSCEAETSTMGAKFRWVRRHEAFHIKKLGKERADAFLCLLALRRCDGFVEVNCGGRYKVRIFQMRAIIDLAPTVIDR
jgi:hypothetical protein